MMEKKYLGNTKNLMAILLKFRGNYDQRAEKIVREMLATARGLGCRRTNDARYRRRLYGFVRQLNPTEPLTTTQVALLKRLAWVCIQCEDIEAAFFKSDDIDTAEYHAATRQMNSLMRSLGLAQTVAKAPEPAKGGLTSLQAYLAQGTPKIAEPSVQRSGNKFSVHPPNL